MNLSLLFLSQEKNRRETLFQEEKMSVPILDYLPCNLTRYSQHVLPAWQAARQGNLHPLRELMSSADHLSYWPVFNIPSPLPSLFFAGPKSCFGWDYFEKDQPFWPQFLRACRFVPTLLEPLPEGFVAKDKESLDFLSRYFAPALQETMPQEFLTTDELDFWELCSRNLPALFAASASTKPQTFLLGCLFYTFCCQLPSEMMADCREIGNEDVDLWEDYMARTADIKALWDRFSAPAPQPLADQLLAPQTYQDYLASFEQEDRKRRLTRALIDIGHDIMGFLDHEETVYVLNCLPINERPELDAILDGCIRDGEGEKWHIPPELEARSRSVLSRWDQAFHAYITQVEPSLKSFRQTHQEEEQQRREVYRSICTYWSEKYPEAFQKKRNRYYQNIERMETEILGRFRYAAERGWGMIEIRA